MQDNSEPKMTEKRTATQTDRYLLRFFLALGLLGAIFFESILPPSVPNDLIPELDKVAHFVAFGLLTYLFLSARFYQLGRLHWWDRLVVINVVLLIAICDELFQSLNPQRVASVSDILAGLAGILCFAAFFNWQIRRRVKSA